VLCGDSAGGGLTVAGLVAVRDRGLPQPAAGVCLSPWVDLTLTAASIDANADRDPQVGREFLERAAQHYLAGHDPRDPLASPVFADLGGLPPLLIHVGGDEALLDDAHRLAEAADRADVDVTLECWEGMIHVWHGFGPRMPEAGAALASIADWLTSRWTTSGRP
jgi:acetyl esterase/lipase